MNTQIVAIRCEETIPVPALFAPNPQTAKRIRKFFTSNQGAEI